jgi:hypothetical protein
LVVVAAGDFSRVNQVMGSGYSQEFVDHIIAEEIDTILFPGGKPRASDGNWKPDWDAITAVIANKYDATVADQAVSGAKVQWYGVKKDWPDFTSNLVRKIQKYGVGRQGLVGNLLLNNSAWDVFQHSNNKAELDAAISWLERLCRARLRTRTSSTSSTSMQTFSTKRGERTRRSSGKRRVYGLQLIRSPQI